MSEETIKEKIDNITSMMEEHNTDKLFFDIDECNKEELCEILKHFDLELHNTMDYGLVGDEEVTEKTKLKYLVKPKIPKNATKAYFAIGRTDEEFFFLDVAERVSGLKTEKQYRKDADIDDDDAVYFCEEIQTK